MSAHNPTKTKPATATVLAKTGGKYSKSRPRKEASTWVGVDRMQVMVSDCHACSIKDLQPLMEHAFFALTKAPVTVQRIYKHEGNWIEIIPSAKGAATIYDKEILLFLTAQLVNAKRRKWPLSPKIEIKPADVLKFTGRTTGGDGYDSIESSLDRLVGTRIKTNIAIGRIRETENFGLLQDYKILSRASSGRIVAIEIVVSKWFYRMAVFGNSYLLTLDPGYFDLSPLQRRVYELARKHTGYKVTKPFRIGLEKLWNKTGCQDTLRKFRFRVRKMCGLLGSPLLDYDISFDHARDQLVALKRKPKDE